jgi:phage anti-repressor protein
VIPFDSEPGHLFRVNARHLHQKLEVGRNLSTWFLDRIEKFQLIEGKDYEVLEGLSCPESGSSKARAQVTKEYMLTTHTARLLSADAGTPVGRQVIRYLVAREDQLREQETRIRGPTTMLQALRLAAPHPAYSWQLCQHWVS